MRFFSTFVGSFHSTDTYREVRQNQSFYMGYALLVVLLTTLAVTLYFGSVIHRELFAARDGKPALFDDVVQQIATQLPSMSLTNTTLMSSEPTPTVIKLSGSAFGLPFSGIELITIDTSGQTTHENMKTPVLVTSKEFIFKGDKETKIKSMAELFGKDMPSMVLNRAMIDDLAQKAIAGTHKSLAMIYLIFGGIVWFFIAVYMYVMRIFMLLALGLVGLVIGSVTKKPLTYATAVGLAAVSYTPIAILDTVLFAGLLYPTSKLVMFAAGAVALGAVMKISHTPAPTPMIR